MSIVKVDRNNPFNPSEFIGPGWKIAQEDEDARALSLAEIDTDNIILAWPEYDVAREDGESETARLARAGYIRLDAKVLQTFLENKGSIPDELKGKKTRGGSVALIFFDGTHLTNSQGRRFVPCLFFSVSDSDWHWMCCPMDADRIIFGPSLVLK